MAENKPKKVELPQAVAKEYELQNWTGGHRQLFGKFGVIDIEKMTTIQAARLIQMGFSKLQAKKKKPAGNSTN